ncbi:uncharacterized protein LOC129756774 [Uranotaenia lowii]|uniref:uncharacterized protein LOC129739584 n=1 Tax=Uranotaenia lowii TaxID=190385 RepID=UPI00247836E1|nr:uncharacterized protein LOC129739584 [Uranotaenia lowii]XP_055609757.1 uncharacterized protein LOC129756774 [Uranotaenia lowii]
MAKLQVVAAILLFSAQLVAADEEPEFKMHFMGLDKLDGSEKYLDYNYTGEKLSDMSFKMSGHARLLVDMDDSYTVNMRLSAAEVGEDVSKSEDLLNIQKTFCEYMRTTYKSYFYDVVKDVSNFPHYDKCPLPAADYWIKDFEFDGEEYKPFLREGAFWSEFTLTKDGKPVAGLTSRWEIRAD